MLREARAAFVFLTRIPVGGFPYRAEEWRRSSAWFPLVGATVGVVMAGVWHIALPLGALVAASLAYLAQLLLTGAFHEDGLADTADALGGATSRERLFEILKDSRVGSYGALALTLSLLLRVALLAGLADLAGAALILSQGVARMPPVWLMAVLPYISPAAKSRDVTGATRREGAMATLTAVAAAGAAIVLGAPWAGVALAFAASLGVGALLGLWFHRRAGGITGDFLGAAEQAGEIAVLLMLAATQAALGS